MRKFSAESQDMSEVIPELLELKRTETGGCIWSDQCKIAVRVFLHRYLCSSKEAVSLIRAAIFVRYRIRPCGAMMAIGTPRLLVLPLVSLARLFAQRCE